MPPLLVVSRVLPVLMREGRGTFDRGADNFLVLLVLERPRSPFLIRPASASLPKGDGQEEVPNRGQSARCCDDLAWLNSRLFVDLLHGRDFFR
jgi:hypothetical protein